MKIDSSNFKAPPLRPTNSAQKPPAQNQPSAAVSLSQTGQMPQAESKPPVDSAKIQEIKTAIAEGRFKINPEAIADSLIETARDLVGSQRQA